MFDVITIGTATRDVFLKSPLFRVVHDPKHLKRLGFLRGEAQCFALGAKIQVGPPVLTVGGGAANSAVTFARQGFRTGTVVGIGKDPNGRDALQELTGERARVFPLYDRREMTGYSVILLSSTGERTILHFRGASRDVKGTEPVFSTMRAKWVYISPGGIPFSAMTGIARRFRNRGAKIVMNPSNEYLRLGAKRLKPLLSTLDVILVNREEAAYLTGVAYQNERGIFKRFDKLVRGLAVMTDGPKGVWVSDGKKIYHAGIFKEKRIIDRTGAGDAFGSGFVAGLLRKGQATSGIMHAIRLGSANATSVVEQIGAQPGILHRRDFETQSRWKKLKITVQPL